MKGLLIIGLVLGVVLVSGCEKAMEGTGIYGKVIDKETRRPVENAKIVITRRKRATGATRRIWSVTVNTDSVGKYRVTYLDPANYAISVSKAGYLDYSVTEVPVKKVGKMKKVNVRLIRSHGLRR